MPLGMSSGSEGQGAGAGVSPWELCGSRAEGELCCSQPLASWVSCCLGKKCAFQEEDVFFLLLLLFFEFLK